MVFDIPSCWRPWLSPLSEVLQDYELRAQSHLLTCALLGGGVTMFIDLKIRL